MKKLTILTIVIVLLALATPAMSDVSFTGYVQYGVTMGKSDDTDEMTSEEKTEARLTVTATPDDNNTITMVLKLDNAGNANYTAEDSNDDDVIDGTDVQADTNDGTLSLNSEVGIDKVIYESNILAAFGLDLPVSVTLTGGYWEWENKDCAKVTTLQVEDVIDTKNKSWQFQVDTGIMDMVTVRVAIDPEFKYQASGDEASIGYLIGAFGGYGPVSAEVFYTNASAGYDEPGELGIGVGVDLAFGDIGLAIGADVNLPLYEIDDEGAADDVVAKYGVGVKFSYASLVSAGIGMFGTINDAADSQPVTAMGIDAKVTPVDIFSISAGVVLALYEDAEETLDMFEVLAEVSPGALTIGAGFVYIPDDITDGQGTNYDDGAIVWKENSRFGGFAIQTKCSF
jgi:hypothetical protein